MVMRDMDPPRDTFFLERGQYDQHRDKVTPGVPAVFPPIPEEAPRNRLGLARWLLRTDHPLTARVTLNRFWQQIFGAGLVRTAEDFGLQGEWPSHPDLLDWLATEFMQTGWDVKALHRLLVLSATYRQSSAVTAAHRERDPENRLLSRGLRLRLDAEVIRDLALVAGGLLQTRIGGPSVYPYQPKGLWMEINNRKGYAREYPASSDPANLYRRGIYTFWKRTLPHPSLQILDAPNREFCTVRRSRTNTPMQALVLMNDPQRIEAAGGLALRMMERGADDAAHMAYGLALVTARQPTPAERAELLSFLEEERDRFRNDSEAALRLLGAGGLSSLGEKDPRETAAWISVARLLLNLDEAVSKE